jgi:pimeloyl-[acyl-carrier protein] synthase
MTNTSEHSADYAALRAGSAVPSGDIYSLFSRLRACDPVWRSPWGNWYLSSYTAVETVLRSPYCLQSGLVDRDAALPTDTAQGAVRDLLDGWILFANPPTHQNRRKLLAKLIKSHSTAQLRMFVTATTQALLRKIPVGSFDFVAHIALPLPVAVICEIAQIPVTDRARMMAWSKALRTALDTGVASLNADDLEQIAEAQSYFLDLAADKAWRARAFGGLIGTSELRMTSEEFASNLLLVVFSGHETTAHLLASLSLHVVGNPVIWNDIRSGRVSRTTVIDETLRLESPIQKLCRVNSVDMVIEGITIPAGSSLVLLLGAANRDPKVFAHADTVHYASRLKMHLAFGLGTHYCLGTSLALLEADVALQELAMRWKRMTGAADSEWVDNSSFRGLASFQVTKTEAASSL